MLVLFLTINANSLMQKAHEKAGVNLQFCRIGPEIGDAKSYTAFSIPLMAQVQNNRYMKFSARLNQGYQSYDGEGVYGFSDLDLGGSYLYNDITILGGIRLPIGTKEIKSDKFTTVSAGRLPYINSSLVYASSGFGFHAGASYGTEMSSDLSLAFGALYYFRGEYVPLKGMDDYNPADEFRLAAGADYSQGDFGFFGKTVLSFYSQEKLDGKKLSEPGMGLNFIGNFVYTSWSLETVFSKRGESELKWGGDFEPPSLFSFKLSYADVWDYAEILEEYSVMPYVGFEKTGEGSMTKGAGQLLLGCYLKNFFYKGFPGTPYFELRLGSISGDASLFGFKVGTDINFQIYK